MKTAVKKSSDSEVRKILSWVSVTVALLHGASAFAEGGGHNGPDLSGPSIPVKFDGLLTVPELQKAVVSCLNSTVNEIVSQVLKAQVEMRIEERAKIFNLNPQSMASGIVPGTFTANFNGSYISYINSSFYLSGSCDEVQYGKRECSTRATYHLSGDDRVLPESFNFSTENFPFLAFDPIRGKPVYDDLGREVDPNIQVSNLRFYLPQELNEAEPLVNDDTNQKTTVTIDLKRYVDCIKASIQR